MKKIDVKKIGRPSLHDGRPRMRIIAFRIDDETLGVLDRLVDDAVKTSTETLPRNGLRSAFLRQLVIEAGERSRQR